MKSKASWKNDLLAMLIVFILIGVLYQRNIDANAYHPNDIHHIVMVQQLPNNASFYNTAQQDYFNLVYVYPYFIKKAIRGYAKPSFWLFKIAKTQGYFAFQFKKDNHLTALTNQELVLFLAANNLPTPKAYYVLQKDTTGFIIDTIITCMLFTAISYIIYTKVKNVLTKQKIPGYLKRKRN